MISAELVISMLSELTTKKIIRNIHGDYKRFDLVLNPERIISDEHLLYISTPHIFEKVVKNINPSEGQRFSFILSSKTDITLDKETSKYICVNAIDLPIDVIVNEFSRYETDIKITPPANVNRYASAFLIDLVEGHLAENEEIVENIKRAPINLKQHISIVVIESLDSEKPLRIGTIEDFASCFPNCLAAYHNGNILILTQKDEYTDPIECDIPQLEKILAYNNAIAALGNYSKWLTSVRPSYTVSKKAMKFIRLRGVTDRRFFLSEEFCLEEMIDVCAKYAPDYTLGDIHHICSPVALELYMNSEMDNEDYDKIVEAFIDCDRNVSKTADKLFYNRNTLKQKLEKMETRCESFKLSDLEDPKKRYAIRFSLMIINHMKTVIHRKSVYTIKELIPATAEQLD